MNRPVEMPRNAVTAIQRQPLALTRQSERTILLGTVLLVSALSATTGFILAQYYSIDVFSSLVYVPQDCWLDWRINVGRHCFSDYAWQVQAAMQPNPWAHFGPPHWPNNPYPPATMVPHLIFGLLGKWLGAPRIALYGYLIGMTIAVLTPALWAARGAHGLERVVVFVACGAAAIPAWLVLDRGNSTGFLVPIALVFLVALCRRRWGLVTIMVILVALVKPQFAVLGVALFAARQWRLGGIAVIGVVTSNLAAYLLWPQDFPRTITQSIHNSFGYGFFHEQISHQNTSFAKALLLIPDGIIAHNAGGKIPDGYLAGPRSLIGYGVLMLVVAAVLALGRRIPPVMVGIVLLATAALFPAVAYPYYLVFVLPVAALVARDPDGPPGSGIFDRLGDRRRAVGIGVSLAAALSIAHIVVPGPPIPVPVAGQPGILDVFRTTPISATTVILAPVLWLIACAAIIVSYARRPAPGPGVDAPAPSASGEPTPVATSHGSAAIANPNTM